MSNSNITKRVIAGAMKDLMKHKKFKEISVKDIIGASGVGRKTFYNHFQDKYHLVNWIFSEDIMEYLIQNTSLKDCVEDSEVLCRYIYENREFYIHAMKVEGQNCFIDYLHTLTENQIIILIDEIRKDQPVKQEDAEFLIAFYYNAFIGILKYWAEGSFSIKPEIIAEKWKSIVQGSLRKFVKKHLD